MSITLKPTTDTHVPAEYIAGVIIKELELGKNVLWFVAGGSSIPVAVEAARIIREHSHQKLTVTLTDERYGPLDHTDSNWRQLFEKGFNLPGALLIPVLGENNRTVTTEKFNTILEEELKNNEYVIGLFGAGVDGHTAGILPESPAVSSNDLACVYHTESFERITITPKAIGYLDEIIIFAQGREKWKVIEDLLEREIDITKQPAQILKQAPLLTIFSDYTK